LLTTASFDAAPPRAPHPPTYAEPSGTADFPLIVPPPPQNYTLSLHDALPILDTGGLGQLPRLDPRHPPSAGPAGSADGGWRGSRDRQSTRLNSSHSQNSYGASCSRKKRPRRRSGGASAVPAGSADGGWGGSGD